MKRFFRQYGRLTLALAAVLAFCAVLPLLFQQSRSIETGSWGLSFRTEGQPPVGNASKEALRRYDAVYLGDETQKKIYLTFDAGYENGCTEPILEALAKHNVKAAFFVVGNYIEQNPDLVRRMLREGHIIGNHTYHHYDMSKLSDEAAFNQELTSLETLYRETTGEDMPRYYRPPQGIYSECNLEMAQKLGYRTVFWSLAYVDWYQDNQPTDEQAFSKLLPRIHPGAIVLLHSTSSTNAEILDELLTKWEAMGYRFASLDELYETARESEDHAERAAEEHEASDHHEYSEHKTGDRRTAAARRKFLLGKCHEKAAEDQTDDLGPDVLHGLRRVKAQRARRVAQEAGHAEAHVLGIPEQHQQRRDHADDETGENHVAFFVFERHRKLSFFLFVALS